MSINILATARNFLLFMEVREKFQVVYGTFWIKLFLAYHRTFGIFLIRAGNESRFWRVLSLVMYRMIWKDL